MVFSNGVIKVFVLQWPIICESTLGIVACIISFLMSILVLITRLPLLKVLNLLSCFLAGMSEYCLSEKYRFTFSEWHFHNCYTLS